jgi:hypothetical protein
MRRCLDVLALVALFLVALPAHAIDPGVARGFLRIGAATVQVSHAYAYLHAPPNRSREMRIAIVDREVPQESLSGHTMLPIEQLARDGKVRGILVRYDPAKRRKVVVTVLDRPYAPGKALVSFEHGRGKNLVTGNNRVLGALDSRVESAGRPDVDYRVQFSAPLFRGH